MPTSPPPPPPKPSAIVYIDGLNLYYNSVSGTPFKWLNLKELFTRIRNQENIIAVKYFTALVKGPRRPNQQALISALVETGVEVIYGQFREKPAWCKIDTSVCSLPMPRKYSTYEEKRTDVNIAVWMIQDAIAKSCDQMILVSGDSDLCPAVQFVTALGIPVSLVIPRKDGKLGNHSKELRKIATHATALPLTALPLYQFPNPMQTKNGPISKPSDW